MDVLNSLRLPAKIENLTKFRELVNSCCIKFSLGEKRVYELQIAVEEALVNIFNYAYPDNLGYVELICFSLNSDKLVIEIRDSGIPFDPNSIKEPDINSGIMERQVGGVGIFLIKKLVDELHYYRKDNINVLQLVVYK